MALIIDGYNLLHVSGIFGRGTEGAGSFERARRALLDFVAEAVDETDRQDVTVVFDAQDAPPGLPKRLEYRGLVVQYAPRREEADDLIEALIGAHTTPRRLTVVSSDHRLQRAARRRKAAAVDSDVWFRAAWQRRAAPSSPQSDLKPEAPLADAEVQAWVRRFTE